MEDPRGKTRDKTGQGRPAKLDWAFRAYRCKSSFHQNDDEVTCNFSASCNYNPSSTGPSSFQTSPQLEKRPQKTIITSVVCESTLLIYLADSHAPFYPFISISRYARPRAAPTTVPERIDSLVSPSRSQGKRHQAPDNSPIDDS